MSSSVRSAPLAMCPPAVIDAAAVGGAGQGEAIRLKDVVLRVERTERLQLTINSAPRGLVGEQRLEVGDALHVAPRL
jgi:hypothetical protein